jgi:hypothetical protein
MKLYGTEENSSIPIQIGGGNIDKVANFRVYDKFIGEDQALEIWDAQKDEFGRAKSSMTLHKGRLGLGTTEPEGRLAVADEPDPDTYGLQEFPPKPLAGYKTHFEGHGVFCASASNDHQTNVAWEAFDKSNDNGRHYQHATGSGGGYSTSDGSYGGSVRLSPSSGTPLGVYLALKMPYKIHLKQFSIQPRNNAGYLSEQTPKDGQVWGSNDGDSWYHVHSYTGLTFTSGTDTVYFNVNHTNAYSRYALIVTKSGGGTNSFEGFSIGELRYFGYREQVTKQSVLHDGQLTLTKSLTVPRIGPALDADDTPRRDRLVVEYNTSTNPTFDGAVRDTSGRGNDGIFIGTSPKYYANEKYLQVTTQGDAIQSPPLNNPGGAYIHSFSIWFKMVSIDRVICQIGADSQGVSSGLYINNNNINHYFFGNDRNYVVSIGVGSWNHIVATYDGGTLGGSRRLWFNGEEISSSNPAPTTTVAAANIEANTTVRVGSRKAETNVDSKISNFKLYDVALTAEEAKTLYDMGRCDEGHHMVNFSKTRVGIGLGDGEAPHDELDVRGNVRGSDNVIIGPYSGQWWRLHTFQTNGNLGFYGEDGTEHGYLLDSGTVNNIDFTGQHRAVIDKVNVSDYENFEGLIVSANKNKYINVDNDITTGSNAIQISQSLPLVSLSNVVHDKACYGVIAGSEDVESRTYEQGTFVSVFQKQKGDTRAYINSVGEGAIWVTNTNGSLESGDYITTSNVAGYGQKQESEFLANYTVAKITMDCDFNPATQPIQQILRSNVIQTYYLGNVHKVKNVPHEFVTTTVTADDAWSNVSINPSDTTYAEWSNLEANTQNTYALTYTQTSNVVYDTKYTLTTTANVTESDAWDRVSIEPPGVTYAEYSNLEANTQSSYSLTFTKTTTDEKTPDEWSALESNVQSLYNKVYYQSVEEEVAKDYPGAVAHTRVTDVIENELDAHGQIQWEDHATETEKAYKIRYLDASGVETDSANAVHIAAFVGCTYHCG